MIDDKTYEYSVVVGRFQTDRLHNGHIKVLSEAQRIAKEAILVLGSSPLMSTSRDPLDFWSRHNMILESFSSITTYNLDDGPCDKDWSERLDELVSEATENSGSVILIGGRDSFLKSYCGKYRTYNVPVIPGKSSTERRAWIREGTPWNEDARAGAIWATGREQQWHEMNAKMCVDMIITRHGCVLMGTKHDDPRLRLPGGFVDNGETLEMAAQREIFEETGMTIPVVPAMYRGSFLVDDWRYRPLGMKITTAVFKMMAPLGQNPVANDDLETLQWVKTSLIHELKDTEIALSHREVLSKLMY